MGEMLKAILIVAIVIIAAIILGALRKMGLLKIIWYLIVLPSFCAVIIFALVTVGNPFIGPVLERFERLGKFGNLVGIAFISASIMQIFNLIFGAIYKTVVGKDYQDGGHKELY